MNTKQDIVLEALEDIGFDSADAREIKIGVRELRNMCVALENEGVYVNFNITDTNLPGEESGISLLNRDAIVKNLAVRIASILDVAISPAYAGMAASALEGITPFVIEGYEANPLLPEGAGDRLYDQNFFYNEYQSPDEIYYVNVGEKVEVEKNLFDETVDGSIVSADWTVNTSTVTVTDTTINGTIAKGMVQFSAEGDYIVKILVTYDSGEIDSKCIAFQVDECRESPNLYRFNNLTTLR